MGGCGWSRRHEKGPPSGRTHWPAAAGRRRARQKACQLKQPGRAAVDHAVLGFVRPFRRRRGRFAAGVAVLPAGWATAWPPGGPSRSAGGASGAGASDASVATRRCSWASSASGLVSPAAFGHMTTWHFFRKEKQLGGHRVPPLKILPTGSRLECPNYPLGHGPNRPCPAKAGHT